MIKGSSCSFRTNLLSFIIFRYPLFPKPVSWLGLFLTFLTANQLQQYMLPFNAVVVFFNHSDFLFDLALNVLCGEVLCLLKQPAIFLHLLPVPHQPQGPPTALMKNCWVGGLMQQLQLAPRYDGDSKTFCSFSQWFQQIWIFQMMDMNDQLVQDQNCKINKRSILFGAIHI